MAETVLRCAGCNMRYRVKSFDSQKKYACPKCKGPLKPESGATDAPDAQSLASEGGAPPEPVRDPLIGQRIAHYQVIKKLGQGGMGAVYQVQNLKLQRTVALKVLPPDLAASNKQFALRFIREARAQAAISHPNVVSIHDVGKSGDYYYIDMDFVEGGSAADLLKAPCPSTKRWPLSVARLRG